jgi:sugar phosphate isomerase/epimerase
MRTFGFSTGALANGDLSRALEMAARHDTDAVELSALRLGELESTAAYLVERGVGHFHYVAFHAPSCFSDDEEGKVVSLLRSLVEKLDVQIVVHPDAIHDFSLWQSFSDKLCIENMDHRKPIGRTADELAGVFRKLPAAQLCFDIGHAHEIDRSMSLGYEILRRFGARIAHIHASEVSDECEHRGFTSSSHAAFAKLADLIPSTVAVILETVVPENRVAGQLEEARCIFGRGAD